MRLPVAILSLILAALPSAIAWGALGHRTVAYLASLSFTPESTVFVNHLLNGQDVSESSLYPDKIAHARLHFWPKSAQELIRIDWL